MSDQPAASRLLAWGLFLAVVLIWGTTWYAIRLQLNGTPPTAGVAWRFLIAALVMWGWVLVRGHRIDLPPNGLWLLLPYGLTFFCFNYLLVYAGTQTVPSGLVSVLFSTVILFSLVWEVALLRTFPGWSAVAAVVLGIGGLALVFLTETEHEAVDAGGAVLILGSALVASTGNTLSAVLMKRGYAIVDLLTVGMSIGAVATFLYAFVRGDLAQTVVDAPFLWALFYLAVIGSVAAFGLYFMLVKRLGPTRAAYASVLFPLVALVISAIWESYHLSLLGALGVAMLIAGAALAIGRKR